MASLASLILLILSLALDTLGVSTALGVRPSSFGTRVRIILLFVLLESGIPLVGLGIGALFGRALRDLDTAFATLLLIGAGIYIWREVRAGGDDGLAEAMGRRSLLLILLPLAVGVDELAIGISFGVLRPALLSILLLIATQAALVAPFGLAIGAWLGRKIGENVALAAAAILVILGGIILAK